MTFALVTTHHFEYRARKFLRKHPDLKPTLADTLERLRIGIGKPTRCADHEPCGPSPSAWPSASSP